MQDGGAEGENNVCARTPWRFLYSGVRLTRHKADYNLSVELGAGSGLVGYDLKSQKGPRARLMKECPG